MSDEKVLDLRSPEVEELQKSIKESNEDRKRDKLQREIVRAHEWRVQVWAQMELKIRTARASLAVLNSEPEPLFEPDFEDESLLHHYASMKLSK